MPDLKPIPDDPKPYWDRTISISDLRKVKDASLRQVTGGDGVSVEKFGDRINFRTTDQAIATPLTVATFFVIEEKDNWLKCTPYTFKNDDPKLMDQQSVDAILNDPDTMDQVVWVAKPYTLQKDPWDTNVIGGASATGVTYEYTSIGERTATGNDADDNPVIEDQIITPSYFQGDIIVARKGPTGYPVPDWEQRLAEAEADTEKEKQTLVSIPEDETPMITWIDMNEAGRAWAVVS